MIKFCLFASVLPHKDCALALGSITRNGNLLIVEDCRAIIAKASADLLSAPSDWDCTTQPCVGVTGMSVKFKFLLGYIVLRRK